MKQRVKFVDSVSKLISNTNVRLVRRLNLILFLNCKIGTLGVVSSLMKLTTYCEKCKCHMLILQINKQGKRSVGRGCFEPSSGIEAPVLSYGFLVQQKRIFYQSCTIN